MGQGVVVSGCEKKIALCGIEKALADFPGHFQRQREPVQSRARALQVETGGEPGGEIVEKGRHFGAAFGKDAKPAAVFAAQPLARKVRHAHGEVQQFAIARDAARMGEAGNRQRVPAEQALGIGVRRNALRARGEEIGALGGKIGARAARQIPQHRAALEVSAVSYGVGAAEGAAARLAEHRLHLCGRPYIEAAFFALAVGVLAGVESALCAAHFALQPRGGFAHRPQQLAAASAPPQLGVDSQQLPLVVEHLLKMRHAPVRIYAVAVEAAAELVVATAPRHFLAGEQQVIQRVLRLGFRQPGGGGDGAGNFLHRQQHFKLCGRGKLGRCAEAAVGAVGPLHQRARGRDEQLAGGRSRVRAARALCQDAQQLLRRLIHALPLFVKSALHRLQNLAKRGQAVARLRRIVGARVKGAAIGPAKSSERPAAVALQPQQRIHVEPVHIGPLLAVHLDADEVRVHQRRRLFILEGFALHHMAPVAGAVANGDQQRPLLRPRAGQRLFAPGVPVHRVVHMLAQIGAALSSQPVRHLPTLRHLPPQRPGAKLSRAGQVAPVGGCRGGSALQGRLAG